MENGQKRLVPVASGVTDDEGSFRLANLIPGRYYLSFPLTTNQGWSTSYQSNFSKKRIGDEGYGPQFYPGVPDLESASVIEIRAGVQVHIAETLSRQRFFEVSGVVRGADPESGFNLMLMNSAGDVAQRSVRINPKTGQFQIQGVLAGNYLLRATSNQPRAQVNTADGWLGNRDERLPPLAATLALPVHGDVSGLVLTLGSGISVGVQVRDEISDHGSASQLPHQVSLQMIPQDFPQSSSWITVPPDPSQWRTPTRFEGLAPDTYTVSGAPNGPWYISSMRCGSVDLLREDLIIPQGAAPPPIEVTLRDDGAQLTVKAMEKGQPAVGGVVLFSREYPRQSQLFFGSGDSISVGNLAPGTYYVVVLRNAENVEFRNPTTMEQYLSHATEVNLGPRAEVTVVAEVQAPAEGSL